MLSIFLILSLVINVGLIGRLRIYRATFARREAYLLDMVVQTANECGKIRKERDWLFRNRIIKLPVQVRNHWITYQN